MARPTSLERDRIRKALENHARTSQDLTVTAYANAAGITRDTARVYLGQMGLPAKRDPDPVPPTPGVPTTPTPTTPTPAANPAPANPAGGETTVRLLLNQLLAVLPTVPAAVGAEVRQVLDQVVYAKTDDPAAVAAEAARSRIVADHVSRVVADAGQIHADDLQAGEIMRRKWREEHLDSIFGSPGELVNATIDFWWKNRDLIPQLRERAEVAELALQQVAEQYAPAAIRRQRRDEIMMLALAAAVNGHPLPATTLQGYLDVADREPVEVVPSIEAPPVALPAAERG